MSIKEMFLHFLKKVFGSIDGSKDVNENEKLVSLGESQEEKDAIAIICDDVDLYHEEMKVMQENNIDEGRLGEYTKYRVVQFAAESEPSMSSEEKQELAEDIEAALEEIIVAESQYVANDVAGEDVDVEEIINSKE